MQTGKVGRPTCTAEGDRGGRQTDLYGRGGSGRLAVQTERRSLDGWRGGCGLYSGCVLGMS